MESVKLTGIINDTNEVITLGDTLSLDIKIDDSIESSSGKIKVYSLQYTAFYMEILKVDTIDKSTDFPAQSTIWTSRGSRSSRNGYNYLFEIATKPYGCTINFKPIEKGIYYFGVVTQPGDIKINNDYHARLSVGFNTVNNHLHLVSPYFGGQTWENDIIMQNINQGTGFYVFRVN